MNQSEYLGTMRSDTISPKPLFICGYPKSGTTLLSSLLDGHSQIAVLPEETFLLAQAAATGHEPASLLEWLLCESKAQENLRKGLANGRNNFDYRGLNYESLSAETRRTFASSEGTRADVLLSFGSAFCRQSGQTGKAYLCEKSPGNELFAATIFDEHPAANLIYLRRDPRDVFNSYRTKRRRYPTLVNDLSLSEFIEKYALSLFSIQQAITRFQRVKIVDYEDLVSNPVEVMHELSGFLGVDFEISMTAPTRFGQVWPGNSMTGIEFCGVSASSVGRWREELDPAEAGAIDSVLRGSDSDGTKVMSPRSWMTTARSILSLEDRRPRVARNIVRLRLARSRTL